MPRQFDASDDWELWSTGKAAKYLNVSPQSVRNFAGSGFLQAITGPTDSDPNIHYRFWKEDVLDLAVRFRLERNGEDPESGPWGSKGHKLSP